MSEMTHRTPLCPLTLLLQTLALVVATTLPSSSHERDSSAALTTLKSFPSEAFRFQDDIAPWVDRIVARHGKEEWRCVVLTHELHGHMGVLNVLGAKMGLRARELLKSPREGLHVVSFAGLTTPLSCFNDGLQIATGATLGRGTIQVETASPRPGARISSEVAECELTVKPEIMKRITQDIDSVSARLGFGSAPYFAAVRELSMQYWFELDRAAIFEEAVGPRKQERR
jgi:pyrimidine-specific ribonucleoside hydrolase